MPKFAQALLLLITPIAPLAYSLSTSPSLAATLGTSEATVRINNFSQNPLDVVTLTDTFTDKLVTNGQVNDDAITEAAFLTDSPVSANNLSYSSVNGNGSEYFGSVETIAAVSGYDFVVNKGETFSFNFAAGLNLATSIDNSQFETANASGNITLRVYDTTNRDNWINLDSFTLSGNLTTSGNKDYLDYQTSQNISLNPSVTTIDTNFGGDRESANAAIQGIFSRTFDSVTNLTLVEVKNNQASVSVPEPSSFLGLLLCVIGMGYRIKSKGSSSK
ncbi:MAG TPA: PEP-CTERM sorting domain-containing protein [Cyanobacteria bacterium UBA11049]|nr:PEP-CTERM sorting domain-containing protein [Cyanobacteria bacterium UBA11049]